MKFRILVLVAASVGVMPAFAHEVEKGPNGGRVADAGAYHVELVTKAKAIDVFVMDSKDQPAATVGFKGVAILLVDGKQQRIPLEAGAPGRLSGKTSGEKPAALKGVVQLTTPQGGSVQARFK
jgi:hypothetical protein